MTFGQKIKTSVRFFNLSFKTLFRHPKILLFPLYGFLLGIGILTLLLFMLFITIFCPLALFAGGSVFDIKSFLEIFLETYQMPSGILFSFFSSDFPSAVIGIFIFILFLVTFITFMIISYALPTATAHFTLLRLENRSITLTQSIKHALSKATMLIKLFFGMLFLYGVAMLFGFIFMKLYSYLRPFLTTTHTVSNETMTKTTTMGIKPTLEGITNIIFIILFFQNFIFIFNIIAYENLSFFEAWKKSRALFNKLRVETGFGIVQFIFYFIIFVFCCFLGFVGINFALGSLIKDPTLILGIAIVITVVATIISFILPSVASIFLTLLYAQETGRVNVLGKEQSAKVDELKN